MAFGGGGFKKWAGGGKPGGPPGGNPGGAPPPPKGGPPGGAPPKPGAGAGPEVPPAPAPTAGAGGTGENPQMIARAAQALTRLILEGGLPDDVIMKLSEAQQACMTAATGGGEAEEEDAESAGEDLEEEDPEAEEEDAEDPDAAESGEEEGGAAALDAKKPFPQRSQPAPMPK